MHNIYIDEKGPQENIRVRNEGVQSKQRNNPVTRFKLGSDNMTDYIMAAVDVPQQNADTLESKFKKLEVSFLKHSESVSELKGFKILKGKKFEYGIASMPPREVDYYTKVIELLMNQDAKLCIVTQSKTASIITQRLHFWILEAAKKTGTSYSTLAYTLAKYATIEASESVLQELQNSNKSVYQILNIIKVDLKRFIREHQGVERMLGQNNAFADVLKIIRKTQNIKTRDTPHSGEFEWDKVDFSLNLWLLDRKCRGENNEYHLFLDEGIKKKAFAVKPHSDIRYKNITEGCRSEEVYGIRLADLMATMFGKMISTLTLKTLYNPRVPGQTVYLSEEWFSLNQEQLNLLHLLYQVSIQTGLKFSFNNDTYFDDAVALQAYLTYISGFRDPTELEQKDNGVEEFKVYHRMAQQRFSEMLQTSADLKGNVETAISDGTLKPF